MSECTHDCSTCPSACNCSSEPLKAEPHKDSRVKKVIAVVSGKGGVGKSLVTGLMACAMQRRGHRVAVLDADVTGPSVPRMFCLTQKAMGDETTIFPVYTRTGIASMSINLLLENDTDPVVWRGSLISGAVKQFWTDVAWGDVDFLFVDMPPGTGDVPLTVFQSLPVDGILIVTSPQELVGMIVEKAVKMARMMNVPVIGIVENMAWYTCPDCGKKHYPFGEGKTLAVAEAYSLPVLARLPIDPDVAAACDRGEVEQVISDWVDGAAVVLEHL